MSTPSTDNTGALLVLAREVEDFVGAGGWDQPTQLFALVNTATLAEAEPSLADSLDLASRFTPIAQDQLGDADLGQALAEIEWPTTVEGCALAQHIVVLPPEAEQRLADSGGDAQRAAAVAAEHPDRREGRLVAAVLRDGAVACVLRLRPASTDGETEELLADPELAPNLTAALLQTFAT
ncbi:MAG: PPA1309 family protein [Sciscionella sp.]